jgi:5-methylcytosine-specific restriction protein B
MAPRPIEAIFFFRYTTQVFRACYGRLNGTRYTKNYIQVSGDGVPQTLDEVLGRNGDEKLPLEFVWPGGSEPRGELRRHRGEPGAAHRVQIVWKESGHAPKPWKLGAFADPTITIPGDPTQPDDAGADVELERLDGADLGPWLVAVKLADEPGRLHARAYLERPPAGREQTALGQLPPQILQAVQALPAGAQSGVLRPRSAPPPTPRAAAIVAQVLAALEHDPNVLLIGPPGTGKTVALEDLRALAEHGGGGLLFDPDRWHDAFVQEDRESKVVSLVFHPSYAYENFVAGLLPEPAEQGFKLVARPGPLVSLAQWAASSDRRALLILDEFNRGPAAAIFGDTLALLDAAKRSDPPAQAGAHIARPHAGASMLVAPEFADVDGERSVPDELRLPAGVQIVAALNSSDRSVAPLDAALRRRFAILPVGPDLDVLADHLGIPRPADGSAYGPADDDPERWTDAEVKELALRTLATLNERLAFVLSDDFLLGHALLWPVGEADGAATRDALCRAFDQRVTASLRITFTDQDDLLAAVLGAGEPDDAPAPGPRVARWRQAPESVAGVAGSQLVVPALAPMPWRDAGLALRALLAA